MYGIISSIMMGRRIELLRSSRLFIKVGLILIDATGIDEVESL